MTTEELITLDWKHCWHPFTPQDAWIQQDPVMIESADGAWLTDTEGDRYLDANSSIWTNIHGHNHPVLNDAITDQLSKVAHTSYLGYAHPRASLLAEKLCAFFPTDTLTRCFFSDDGSTAVEVAMKMSLQSRLQTNNEGRKGFLCFQNSYHGDTMGAASLGGVSLFFDRFAKLGLPVHRAEILEDLYNLPDKVIATTTALIIEPMIQGVNQMTPWPDGMLRDLRNWTTENGIHLILDEVMTGFGRTGKMFACQHEEVIPDFLCLAKGLTAGYLPMAATLTTEEIYKTFLGKREYAFYYGHSYTANQLGCAVALASLEIFNIENTLSRIKELSQHLSTELSGLQKRCQYVYEIRQLGLVCGIEFRHPNGEKFPAKDRIGDQLCKTLVNHGVLTRPILDTIVFMPPFCITKTEISMVVESIETAAKEI